MSPQPMETAPHDPTKRFAWDQPRLLGWCGDRWHIIQFEPDAISKRPKPYWSIEGLRTEMARANQPTAWLPMPADLA
jgi:hypothetical protein